METFDVVVIGGGPAGLASAYRASQKGGKVLLIEREAKLGGILKQCIHDGFGVTRFKEKLSGPEYAQKEIDRLETTNTKVELLTFVTKIEKREDGFSITYVNQKGVSHVKTHSLIVATGCRERTNKQVFIQGTNPSGVMTAGLAQYYINILGKMPIKKCVILGSGDIGLIMARRITLEGGEVEGVYEVKPTPSGLKRNIVQCLEDYQIPLHLSHTVTRVYGVDRLEGVEIAKVDEKMRPIKGTERYVECDSLILSVGLIPDNEISKKLGVSINPKTKGPDVDQEFMTLVDHVYSCGNAMHVNDLADYVSESGEIAGESSVSKQEKKRDLVPVEVSKDFLYVVPNYIDFSKKTDKVTFYFRARDVYQDKTVSVILNGKEVFHRAFKHLRPPEMEKILVNLPSKGKVQIRMEDK